jgi:hypothetical protein
LSLRRTLFIALAVAGCHRPPPGVVRSCSDDLSGIWRAEDARHSRFRVTDDGRRVTLEPTYEIAGDYGKFKTVLERTGKGTLAGTTRSTYTQGKKTCPVTFESRIESCKDGRLELAGEMQFEIKIETCEILRNGVVTTATLVREAR